MVELGGDCIIPTRLSKGQRRARRDPGRGRGGSCAGPQTAAKGNSRLVLSASDSNPSSASREWGAPSLGENLFREMDARMTRWLLTARLNRGAGFDLTLSRHMFLLVRVVLGAGSCCQVTCGQCETMEDGRDATRQRGMRRRAAWEDPKLRCLGDVQPT